MSLESDERLRTQSATDGEGTDSVPLAAAPATSELLASIATLLEEAARATEIVPAPPEAPAPVPPAVRVRPRAVGRGPSRARAHLLRLVLVLVAACVVSPLLSAQSGGHAYTIASNSMAPTMPKGSLVLTHAGEPRLHDVVVYQSQFTGTLQVHRIVEVRDVDGERTYIARGDHNDAPDSIAVRPSDIRGIVTVNFPLVGHLWLLPAMLQVVLFTGFLVAYLGIVAWDARAAIGRRLVAVIGVGIVLLLVAPAAFGAVSDRAPGSVHALDANAAPLPMSAGDEGSATLTDNANRATAHAGPPKLWKEFPMWGCDAAGTCTIPVSGTTYALQAGSQTGLDAAKFTPTPTFFLEAVLLAPAGQNISVKLRDVTANAYVAGAVVTTTTSTGYVLARSSGFPLANAHEYQFASRVSGGTGQVQQVKVLAAQVVPTSTETQARIATGASKTSTAFAESPGSVRWTYDGAQLDGVSAVYFETVGSQATVAGVAQARLVRTDGTVIATNSLTTTVTRTRSADIKASLTNGASYWVEFKANSGVGRRVDLFQARMVVQQTAMTKTVNYVDLGWKTTSTSTTLGNLGYDAKVSGESEFEGSQYFEATVQQSGATNWAGVQLRDNTTAATVTGSTQTNKGTTKTAVRSADLALDPANATYRFQGNASAGTSTFFNAWIIDHVNVANGRTYDHVLRTTPISLPCTWTFHAQQTTDANTARLGSFKLQLRGDAAAVDEVVWSGGGYSSTTGADVSVPSGTRLEHVVTYDGNSAGVSSMTADVVGACGGLHTRQTVVYEFD